MTDPVAVTIFGRHAPSWMRALNPGAPVWSKLSAVRSVRLLEPSSEDAYLPPDPKDGRPVLIPLLEPHIRSRPCGYFTLCPSPHALETLADKGRFADFVKDHGLQASCPAAYDTIEDATFPLLAKPTSLNGGNGIRLLGDRAQYEAFRASPAWAAQPHILQEFVESRQDYSTYLFCREGRIVWYRTFRYTIEAASPIRGPVVDLASEACTLAGEQISSLERFLIPLCYSGPCNVDHKIMPDGTLRVLEINPRLGGSLVLPQYVDDLARTIEFLIADATFEPG